MTTTLPLLLALLATAEPLSAQGSGLSGSKPQRAEPATMPRRPGESQVSYQGCLASRPPPERTTRGGLLDLDQPPPRVQVEAVPSGLIVVDERDHNCCAQARVTSRLRGRAVEVRLELSGDVCRCQCRSTIRTTVAARPGRHPVKLVVVEGGTEEVAYQGEVVVP